MSDRQLGHTESTENSTRSAQSIHHSWAFQKEPRGGHNPPGGRVSAGSVFQEVETAAESVNRTEHFKIEVLTGLAREHRGN